MPILFFTADSISFGEIGSIWNALDWAIIARHDIEVEYFRWDRQSRTGIRDIDHTAYTSLHRRCPKNCIGLLACVSKLLHVLDGIQTGLSIGDMDIEIVLLTFFVAIAVGFSALDTGVVAFIASLPEEPIPAPAETVPAAFRLAQNYPNPFNPSTTIVVEVPTATHVRLTVYDVHGRAVATLADGLWPAGRHEVPFDATQLASGLYFYRMTAADFAATRAMTLLK